MDEYITTEDLAADLNTTRQVIYETRRRNDYPGRLGHRRGKRLMFQRSEITDWLESVPKITTDGTGVVMGWETDPAYGDGETTNDANTAIVWALEGIKKTLDAIHNELRAQRPQYLTGELLTYETRGEDE